MLRVKLLREGVQVQVDSHSKDEKHPLRQKLGRPADNKSGAYRLNEILPLDKVDLSAVAWHEVRVEFQVERVTISLDTETYTRTLQRSCFKAPKRKLLWMQNGGEPGIEIDDLYVRPSLKNETPPVKVFILAGQSNMEGHGIVVSDPKRNEGKGSLEYVVKSNPSQERFASLVDQNGDWLTRDDVWITYLDRKGPLTVGYGATRDRIGPELGFGWVMGKRSPSRYCWSSAPGRKSLAMDFRPPRSGPLPYATNPKQDAELQANPETIGKYYREILSLTKSALDEIKHLVPGSDGSYEVLGFVGIKDGTTGLTTSSTPNTSRTWPTSYAMYASTWASQLALRHCGNRHDGRVRNPSPGLGFDEGSSRRGRLPRVPGECGLCWNQILLASG